MESSSGVVNDIRTLLDEKEPQKYALICSGLSCVSGIPSWSNFLEKAGQLLKNKEITFKNYNDYVDSGCYRRAGELVINNLAHEILQQFSQQTFLEHIFPHPIHSNIVSMGFDGIFTTNYDHLLEDAYVTLYKKSILPILPRQWEGEGKFEIPDDFFIAKLHGDANYFYDVVFASKSYDKTIWHHKFFNIIKGNSLCIFGYGGRDPVINTLIRRLVADDNEKTKIYILGTKSAKDTILQNIEHNVTQDIESDKNNENDRKRLYIKGLERDEIINILSKIRPPISNLKVFDSPWGEMPPVPKNYISRKCDSRVFDFFYSSNKILFLHSSPGNGISTLLGYTLRKQSLTGKFVIFRIEAKEWLDLETYVHFIVSNLSEETKKTFFKQRGYTNEGWNNETIAKALLTSFKYEDRRIIIAIEHYERFNTREIEFFKYLLEQSDHKLKIIFASTKSDKVNCCISHDESLYIKIEPLTDSEELLKFSESFGIDIKILDKIKKINSDASIHTLFILSKLTRVLDIDDRIFNKIALNDYQTLFTQVMMYLKSIYSKEEYNILENVITIAQYFRTPRSLESIRHCFDENLNSAGLNSFVNNLCMWGFMIQENVLGDRPQHHHKVLYGMSSTVRECLQKIITVKIDEEKRILNKIAERFLIKAVKYSFYESIPYYSSALYYYKISGNRNKYIEILKEIEKTLIDNYEIDILKHFLESAPGNNNNNNKQSKKSEFTIELIRARIYRIHSSLEEYKKAVNNANKYINYRDPTQKKRVYLERGILLTMERKYSLALKEFEKTTLTYDSDIDFKILLRIIQTKISLGKLTESINDIVNFESIDLSALNVNQIHIKAMIFRHKCTINIIKISNINNNDTIKSLFDNALSFIGNCMKLNNEMSPKDETGVAVSRIKKAQLFLAVNKYEDACTELETAERIILDYPNSQWWLIVCYLNHATALAKIGDQEELNRADEYHQKAYELWEKSTKDDLRKCELDHTKGLIYLCRKKYSDAEKYIQMSIKKIFLTESPSII